MVVGLQIPGVTLGGLLGSGGMGAVYAGVDDATGREVAVKVVARERCTEPMRRRFEREAHAMLSLRHPNVAAALSYGAAEGGRLFLVMERLHGQDLAAVLGTGRLSIEEAAALALEAALGLDAAHALGLVHRDVKPSNLFLHAPPGAQRPVVKLLDFGLAVAADAESTRVTRTGEVLGTPAYMAPEQARGERGVDVRSDVYALGAVLYHMLTGSPPFGRGSPIEVLVRALTEEVPRLEAERPEVSPALAALVHQALVREPAQRLGSMAAFIEGLRALGSALTVGGPGKSTAGSGASFGAADRASGAPAGIWSSPATLAEGAGAPTSGATASAAQPGGRPGSRPGELRLGADRRVVTVLLASGVTSREEVVAAIEAQGGEATVSGDQVIGVFGGERSAGDEAERAVRAALRCEAAARSIGVGTTRSDSSPALSGDSVTAVTSDPGVRVDAETWRRVRGRFAVSGDRVVRELSEEQATVVSPFVGRSSELLDLRLLVERVVDGEPAAGVLLLGPPGIGKSRVVATAVSAIESLGRGHVFAFARGDTVRRYASWSLLADLVRGLPRDDLEPGPLGAEVLDNLLSPGTPGGGRFTDAQAARDRLLLAVGDLLEAALLNAPLVLVLEDLHEADTPSLELIDALLARLRDQPLVLMATARDHFAAERPGLLAGSALRRVSLRELDRRVSLELCAALGLSPEASERVASQAGGNPLFIEQLAAAGAESIGSVPLTVEEAVQARLDPLPRHVRDGVRVAAAFGVRFEVDSLVAVGLAEASHVVDRLLRDDLVQLERRRSRSDPASYHFRCGLLRDVAYAGLTEAQRRDIHGRIGQLYAGRPGQAADAAHHLTLGGLGQQAIPLWLDAARAALSGGDLRAARSGLDRALPLAEGGPLEAAVRLERLGVVVRCGDVAAARTEHAALAAVAVSGSTAFDAEWHYWTAAIAQWEGRHVDSRDGFARAAVLVAGMGDRIAFSRALAMQAVQVCTGQLGDARPIAERALEAAGEDPSARARALHTRYFVAGYADKPAVARALGDAALAACETAGDARRALEVLTTLAADELELGRLESAEVRLEAVLEKARRLGNEVALGYALHNLGVVHLRRGRVAQALEKQTVALAAGERLGQTRLVGAALYHRALARLQEGDLHGAQADAEAALPQVRGSTEEASALTVRALVHRARDQWAEGLECARAARRLMEGSGHRPELEAELLACEVELLELAGLTMEAQTRRHAAVERIVARADALTENAEERAAYLVGSPARARIMEGPTSLDPLR